jgi:hypothetical protein
MTMARILLKKLTESSLASDREKALNELAAIIDGLDRRVKKLEAGAEATASSHPQGHQRKPEQP